MSPLTAAILAFFITFLQQMAKCLATRAKNRSHWLYLDISSPISHGIFACLLWFGISFGISLPWVIAYMLGGWQGDRWGARLGQYIERRIGARADP